MEDLKIGMGVSELTAQIIIDEIIDLGAELLYDHYIDSRSGPFAITSALAVVENAL